MLQTVSRLSVLVELFSLADPIFQGLWEITIRKGIEIMNRVEITTEGPLMENLARITISDAFANDVFHVDFSELAAARAEEAHRVLDLIAENCGSSSIDIIDAAITNESPVYLDGEDVSIEDLGKSFRDEADATTIP
jgi:hypothetical protein